MSLINETHILLDETAYAIKDLFYNGTYFDPIECTADTCSLLLGTFTYLPNVGANAFFAALFGVLLIANIPTGYYYRTWGVMVGMVVGLALELVGYVGRIMIHNDNFSQDPFLIYIICLTIGPAFLSAAIYLCLARIVVVYGETYSRFKPRTYTIAFMVSDFVSLVLQGAGGGVASTASDQATADIGINMMIAGLVFQVASITLFAAVCGEFAWRVRSGKGHSNPSFDSLKVTWKWKGFLIALFIATLAIYIRSIFRVAELYAGFRSAIANDEPLFMILEAAMVAIASIALTLFHPGLVFGLQWRNANFTLKSGAGKDSSRGLEETSHENGSDTYETK